MISKYWLNLMCEYATIAMPQLVAELQKLPFYEECDFYRIPYVMPNFKEMKVSEMRDLLRQFFCKVSGKKADLQKRLKNVFDPHTKAGYECFGRLVENYKISVKEFNVEHGTRYCVNFNFKRPKRSGYVYCIKFAEYVKIGMSVCCDYNKLVKYLYKRYKTPYGFTALDATNFRCKFFEAVNDVEREIHKKYKNLRLNNSELFKISLEQIEL